MAYNTKYQIHFTTPLGVVGDISFKKEDYSGSIVKLGIRDMGLTSQDVFNGWFDPIMYSNAQMSLHNDSSTLTGYDDLLENDERDFEMNIELTNDSETITQFDGWATSGIYDQKYMLNSPLNISGNNYLDQIENTHIDDIDTIQKMSVIDILSKSLALTGKDRNIYINSTLCPSTAYSTTNKTVLNLAGLESEAFWSDNVDRMGALSTVAEILKAIDCHIYIYNGDWYIERYPDIWNTSKTFYKYEPNVSYDFNDTVSSISVSSPVRSISTLQRINQSETKQHILGVRKLICENIPQRYFSHVTNNYTDRDTWTLNANAPIPSMKKWMSYNTNTPLTNKYGGTTNVEWFYSSVSNYRGITNGCIMGISNGDDFNNNFTTSPGEMNELLYRGLNYRFGLTVSDTSTISTDMKIVWNMTTEEIYDGASPSSIPQVWKYLDTINAQYYIKEYGTSNYLDYVDTGEADTSYWELAANTMDGARQEIRVHKDALTNNLGEYSVTIPLADVSGLTEGDQDFIICFGMPHYTYTDPNSNEFTVLLNKTVLGDVVITTKGQDDPNLIEVEIPTAKTWNTEGTELKLFDIPSLNYMNGFFTESTYNTRTQYWKETGSTTAYDLAQWMLQSKTQLYRKNRKVLTMDVKSTEFFRPFSLWNDPEDGKLYVLVGDSYRIMEDTHSLEFWEYDNTEEINFTDV